MKEYKVLVNKKTGEYLTSQSKAPQLLPVEYNEKTPLLAYCELKPVVLLSKQEYEELRNSDKIECDNCGEIVRMISTGSMCPSCLCD